MSIGAAVLLSPGVDDDDDVISLKDLPIAAASTVQRKPVTEVMHCYRLCDCEARREIDAWMT